VSGSLFDQSTIAYTQSETWHEVEKSPRHDNQEVALFIITEEKSTIRIWLGEYKLEYDRNKNEGIS
jgi:hypothetical protein